MSRAASRTVHCLGVRERSVSRAWSIMFLTLEVRAETSFTFPAIFVRSVMPAFGSCFRICQEMPSSPSCFVAESGCVQEPPLGPATKRAL